MFFKLFCEEVTADAILSIIIELIQDSMQLAIVHCNMSTT